MEDESSDSIVEGLSWLDADSFQWGSLWSVAKKEFSRKLSRMSLPSAGVVCANQPPLATSSSMADFMSKLE